ncbi:hypothetical protein BB558_001944 [Smittium angustum]|uniref:R3H domain-containing protein n=1 Tax=Smittium angustum TaxID=133377 RepID=A0A2U1J9X5_SMIAN|nr:hypothetical protein BB558_001944 [Smittium angustum]
MIKTKEKVLETNNTNFNKENTIETDSTSSKQKFNNKNEPSKINPQDSKSDHNPLNKPKEQRRNNGKANERGLRKPIIRFTKTRTGNIPIETEPNSIQTNHIQIIFKKAKENQNVVDSKPTTTNNEKPDASNEPDISSNDKRKNIRNKKTIPEHTRIGGNKRFNSSLSSDIRSFDKNNIPKNKCSDDEGNKNVKNLFRFDSNLEMSKSLENQLINETYECVICYERIKKRQEIWSCDNCHVIMHIGCVTSWAEKSIMKENSDTFGNKKWRCPGCQYKRLQIPTSGHCFCGKHRYPIKSFKRGSAPHTCNELCSRQLVGCKHICMENCHPGKCPNCKVVETIKECFCGKETSSIPCKNLEYVSKTQLKSCSNICGNLLSCGIHKCEMKCHEEPCPPCTKKSVQMCYCGKNRKIMPVHDAIYGVGWSFDGNSLSKCFGGYSCNLICSVPYKCLKHKCESKCHSHNLAVINNTPVYDTCPLDPSVIKTCPCTKSRLLEDLGIERSFCTDEIPTCDKICSKTLPCGHKCEDKCHLGDCPPCQSTVNSYCRCGREAKQVKCSLKETIDEETTFMCKTVCKQFRVCKKHKCLQQCCVGNHIELEKMRGINENTTKNKFQSQKKNKKNKLLFSINSKQQNLEPTPIPKNTQTENHVFVNTNKNFIYSTEFENKIAEAHKCTLVCNKLLRCGNHKCAENCHLGHCKPCDIVGMEPIVCGCGMTRIDPPVPCGAKIPKCPFFCTRVRECGHYDTMSHECHPSDVSCPPCTVLVSKTCTCSKKNVVKNIPCSRINVSCGEICGNLLDCGSHHCKRLCHPPDQNCLSKTNNICLRICNKPRKCKHKCLQQCHAPSKCREDIPCSEYVLVTCKCGNLKKSITCYEKSIMEKRLLSGGNNSSILNGDIYNIGGEEMGDGMIPCNEVCELVTRNKKLAEALNLQSKINQLSESYVQVHMNNFLITFAKENREFVTQLEQNLVQFVADTSRWNYWFTPMRSKERYFLHLLAPYYTCTSTSADKEPKRSVCWTKKKIGLDLPLVPVSKAAFEPESIRNIVIPNIKNGMKIANNIFETEKTFDLSNETPSTNISKPKNLQNQQNGLLIPVTAEVFNLLKEIQDADESTY